MTTPIDADPFVDALLAALTDTLPASYYVGDAEGAAVPATKCPAVVLYPDPGRVSGHPYAPASRLDGRLVLHGVGTTRKQAQNAARDGRNAVVGDYTVDGQRFVVLPDAATTPLPIRDDSLTPALFVQPVVLLYRSL